MSDPYADIATMNEADPYASIATPVSAPTPRPKAAPKRTLGQDVTGFLANMNRAIPGADEAADAVRAVSDLATGKAHSFGEAWQGARAASGNSATAMQQAHPVAANLATGTGYVVQAVPALLSGGATAAPGATAAAAPGLRALAGRVGARAAKNATVGATYAAGNSLAGEGSAAERVHAATSAILPGAVAGVAVPAVATGAGKVAGVAGRAIAPVARTVVRAANVGASKTAAGPFLDPAREATNRLAAALTKDGLTPDGIRTALAEWQRVGGPSPAFMDLVAQHGGGQNTMALVRGAAMTGSGRNLASQYGNRVAADLQDNAIERTRALVPGDNRTIPAVEASVQQRIAANSEGPTVTAGRGGAGVHARLNERYDQGRQGVNEAYDAARAADPDQAHLPASYIPQVTADLHGAVADFAPSAIGDVRSVLSDFGNQGTLTARDLFETRTRLSNLRTGAPTPQTVAAGRAVQALDTHINAAVDNNAFTGDPNVVRLWQTANRARRAFGQQFEGNDLIQNLTEREVHGAGRTNAIAPEDASNAILGRNGLSPKLDLHRDLARVRDTLGEQSPQWQGLRREALSRVLGRDAGTENYGQAFAQFERESPELARLLMPADEARGLLWNRAGIAAAVGDRAALTAGRGLLSTPSEQHAITMEGVGHRLPIAQTGAAGELSNMIERPTEGATGILNRIGTSTRATRNLAETFGERTGADYQTSIRNMVDQVNNARHINPNSGSQTAGRLADESLVELPTSKSGLVMALWRKLQSGATLTDAEREAIVQMATSQGVENTASDLSGRIGYQTAPRLPAPTGLLAIPAGQQSQRQK